MMEDRTDPTSGEIVPPLFAAIELEMSPQIGDIMGALAKAQGSIEGAKKDRKNDHFKSSYATLASVYDACREALSAAGVAVVQAPFNAGEDIGVVTLLGHSSGQWLRGKLQVKPMKYDAQGAGSVITYLRRYLLSAMVGVAPDDDDGEAAVGRPNAARPQQQVKPAPAVDDDGEAAVGRPNAARPQGRDNLAPQDNKREKMAVLYKSLMDGISSAKSIEGLEEIRLQREKDLETMKAYSPTGYEKILKAANDKIADLEGEGPGETDGLPI